MLLGSSNYMEVYPTMKRWILWFCVCCLSAGLYAAEKNTVTMVDPIIDDEGPFSYLAYPNNEMAMMVSKNGFQLTYDGTIYNRENEFNIYTGNPIKPLMARQKVLYDGYVPVFSYGEKNGDIRYDVESFAWNVDNNSLEPSVAFIRVRVTNIGKDRQQATLATGFRANSEKYRFAYKSELFNTGWMYEMPGDKVIRHGRVLAILPKGDKQEAIPGKLYPGPFNGDTYQISSRAEYCLTYYTPTLEPGQMKVYDFKIPYRSISRDSSIAVQKLEAAQYDDYRDKCISFWKKEIAKGMQVFLPERKANEAWKANLMYDFMAIWPANDSTWVPGVNKFQYNWFWLRDGAYIARTYDLWGHHTTARNCLAYFPRFQKEDGNFESQEGQRDGFGQALFALCQHALITGDTTYAAQIYKHVPPAVEYLSKMRKTDPLGLIPATEVADNELIKGHYTGHNYWALLGVRMAERVARMLGKNDDALRFREEYNNYHACFMKALEKAAGKNGYIPPGLDAKGGQDWGNFIGVYPSEVIDPFDPRVKTSLDKVKKDKYAEGVMTYQGKIHQYVTVKVSQNYVYRGDQEEALKDYYGLLLHTGSAHEMFEWRAEIYGNRDVGDNYPPHGWGSAMLNALLRNMLIQERGGQAGLAPRDIHLFTVLSPEWVQPGQEVSFSKAPTDHGVVSAQVKFNKHGAVYTIDSKWRTNPNTVVIHIPWFVEYRGCQTDSKSFKRDGDKLVFSPEVTKVSVKWSYKPEIPKYSYEKTVADYKKEYRRRYLKYLKEGNKPNPILPPQILTAEERKTLFENALKQ